MTPEFDGDFDFNVIGFMKNINRMMFEEEMIKLGTKPIKLKTLPKPETPLWMKYPKCSCCGNYIIVKPQMVNVRRGRHIRIIEIAWNALILGNKEVMKEAGVTSKDLCISCLYWKSQSIAYNVFFKQKTGNRYLSRVINKAYNERKC